MSGTPDLIKISYDTLGKNIMMCVYADDVYIVFFTIFFIKYKILIKEIRSSSMMEQLNLK